MFSRVYINKFSFQYLSVTKNICIMLYEILIYLIIGESLLGRIEFSGPSELWSSEDNAINYCTLTFTDYVFLLQLTAFTHTEV